MTTNPALEDSKVPVRYKLAAAWTSVLFCYIYCDYFELYVPGKLKGMLDGNIVPLGPVTQGILLGTATMLTIPSLMVLLSLVVKAPALRWLTIVIGVFYTLQQLVIISLSSWAFYIAMSAVEVSLTAFIVWTAWKWPRQAAT